MLQIQALLNMWHEPAVNLIKEENVGPLKRQPVDHQNFQVHVTMRQLLQIKGSVCLSCTHDINDLHVSYVHISSAAVFQQDNEHLKDEGLLHSHFLQQTSVLQIFQITQEFAVNGILCSFFDSDISFVNKSQNYCAD